MTSPDTPSRSTAAPAGYRLRPARPGDVPAIVGLIGELAEFERLTHLMQVTAESLLPQLFGEKPVVEAMVGVLGDEQSAERSDESADGPANESADGPADQPSSGAAAGGTVVAFALCFVNFSTFLGKPGLYLEDLYVQPAHRGSGLGKAILSRLGRLAVERGCGRFEWSVLDWNSNAIGFYERMGATVLPDWRICRITGDALAAYGEGS